MKNNYTIIIVSLLLSANYFSCNKKDKISGKCFLTISNKNLTLPIYTFDKCFGNKSSICLLFSNHNSEYYSNFLDITFKQKRKGSYPLKLSNNDIIFSISDMISYDMSDGTLSVDSNYNDNSFLEITEADKKFKKIKGNFKAIMRVTSGNRWKPVGDTVWVHGTFEAHRWGL